MKPLLSFALIIAAMISIQGGASLAKSLFPLLGAEGATTVRLGYAALILLAIWRPWRRRIDLRAILPYGIALGVMNLSFYKSLERLPLGLAVALEFTGPLSVAIFASKRAVDFLWAFLAIFGIALLLPISTALDTSVDLIGVAYALVAGASWAAYILAGKLASARIESGVVTSVGMVVALLVALPFGVARAGTALFEPRLLPLAVAVAVLSSALPYSIEMIALKGMSTRNFGILMSLEPAIAALAGLIVLGESLAGVQWLAIGCVMVASLGSSLRRESPGVVVPT